MNPTESTKKKETVRIAKKDLARLLNENEQMSHQITDLQTKINELLEENRQFKEQISVPEDEGAPEDWGPGPGRSPDTNDPLPSDPRDPFPHWGPDIYLDGRS